MDKLDSEENPPSTSPNPPSSPPLNRLTSKKQRPSTPRWVNLNTQTPPPVDIDIALDKMMGLDFARMLNAFLTKNNFSTINVGVVGRNPEKSKHLETATMKVGDFWVDFVNLRAESYAGDSRIPDDMRIGTAREDAFRRDLTINSMFFNLCTNAVEDLTGRG
ncbi:hypothetical protein TrRE_jg8051, partial [Triparma retinervis]